MYILVNGMNMHVYLAVLFYMHIKKYISLNGGFSIVFILKLNLDANYRC